MISIGPNQYQTARPADLDAALVAATGFGVAEVERLIGATPDQAARALAPFLAGVAPAPGVLAAAIAADPDARAAIRALYAPAPEPVLAPVLPLSAALSEELPDVGE